MPIEKLRPQYIFDEQRIEELKQIAPECFADGKINWEVLREALGDYAEKEGPDEEHFGLFWPGKREARRLAGIPSRGTLVPMPGEGVHEERTRNIFIEGENLEVLKLLQKSYAGRIKMIYIDPPYNTGNDFVYDDNFTETIDEYLKRTGQIDEEGRKLTTNSKADGRFHSKWLSMMYPRLRLAKNLLKEDGVIFISIDDNEIHNLRQLMNEIFGEGNFVSQIIVQSNKRGQTYKDIAKTHEYIVVFTINDDTKLQELKKEESDLVFKDSKSDFSIRELRNRNPKFGKFNRPNLFYPIYISPKSIDENQFCLVSLQKSKEFSIETYPLNSQGKESCWRWGKTKVIKNNTDVLGTTDLVARQKRDGGWNVYEKYRKGTFKVKSIWDDVDVISEKGTVELGELGMAPYFEHPKPKELVKRCAAISTSEEEIILDFFGGSGTTAQSIYELNLADDDRRSFIIVQIPQKLEKDSEAYKAGFKTIADITKERISKISIKTSKANKKSELDFGFKCYRLTSSNYKVWQNVDVRDINKLELEFETFASALIDNWRPEDLLIEILLIEGFPLDSKNIQHAAQHFFYFGNIEKVTSSGCININANFFKCFFKPRNP
jgi:adenine-specific DNA-methyltransferase